MAGSVMNACSLMEIMPHLPFQNFFQIPVSNPKLQGLMCSEVGQASRRLPCWGCGQQQQQQGPFRRPPVLLPYTALPFLGGVMYRLTSLEWRLPFTLEAWNKERERKALHSPASQLIRVVNHYCVQFSYSPYIKRRHKAISRVTVNWSEQINMMSEARPVRLPTLSWDIESLML